MGANFRESLTEYLERIYKIPDPRPCKEHRFEIAKDGALRCIYCEQPWMRDDA